MEVPRLRINIDVIVKELSAMLSDEHKTLMKFGMMDTKLEEPLKRNLDARIEHLTIAHHGEDYREVYSKYAPDYIKAYDKWKTEIINTIMTRIHVELMKEVGTVV